MRVMVIILMGLPGLAQATGTPPRDNGNDQHQGQAQSQRQGQLQGQAQETNVTTTTTTSANANNAGNSQVTTFEDRAQAPSVSQGSVFIPECGAGGNAGGSQSGGSAFLGIAYVPAWCQDFKYAAYLMSAGDHELACEVMATSKVGKRAAKRGLRAPKCLPPAATPEAKPESTVVVTPDLSNYVTRPELAERDKRIVEAVIQK